MKRLLLLAALVLGRLGRAQAQAGSWPPAGANLAYPRTLLQASALPAVRASLAAPDRLALYNSLWNDVQGAPPADNSSSGGRRARAGWAKNAAFVALLGQQPAGGSLAVLPAAQRQALVASARALLESINTNVEVFATWSNTSSYTEWQWRSKELIDYLIAYDLLRGGGVAADTLAAGQAQLRAFAGNLYQQALTPLGPYTFFGVIKNNHALMTAAALGLAAVVLPDAASADARQQPASWAGAGLYNIDNVLWRDAQRQSDSTQVAGYSEGPYYCKYALLNCLPLFRALGNFLPDGRQAYAFGGSTRSIRNPYYDPKYDLLYGWLTAIRLPDGRLPALEDSYVDMGMPELALTGKAQYVSPLYFSKFSGTTMASALAQLRDVTVDMRAAYLAAAVAPGAAAPLALTALPGSGNLILRTTAGPDSLAAYLHLYGRGGLAQANGGGHSQGDAGSFLLHAQGQLLALDPGYLSYSRRAEVGQAPNHNLVLVDGAGPAIGSPGVASPAQSALGVSFALPQLSYGEVATSYQGASVGRRALLVRGGYYLLADDVRAPQAHAYTWQLHGYGLAGGTAATGTFVDSLAAHAGTWQKNGVSLRAHVTATGGAASYSTATNPHETTYNTAENHTTLLVQSPTVAQVQFLAALCPYTTQPPRVATTSQATTAALATTTADGYRDVAFAQADSTLQTDASGQLPQAVGADGLLNFYSATANGDFAQLFVQQGTVLRVGADTVLHASRRATVVWQRLGPTRYAGYASRATTLKLALGAAPAAVTGPGVAGYAYDAARQRLQVVLSDVGSFAVEQAAAPPVNTTPLPVQLVGVAAERRGAAVQLSWRTAAALNSRGFEVQRQVAGSEFTRLGFVAGQGSKATPTSYAFADSLAPASAAYYRLRLLDLDGTAAYSPVVAVAANPAAGHLAAWPQPARDWLLVQATGPAADGATLQLIDPLGRVVRQQPGAIQTRLPLASLPAGLYYLRALDAAGRPLGGQRVLVAP